MTLVRRFARPLLAAPWIWGGVEALRNPQPKVPDAETVAPPIAAKIPYLPQDPEQLVKINAGVQVGAGSLLALGKFPRIAATALAGSAALTTAAGHKFWQERDPEKKTEQQYEFVQNLGMLGGLVLASVDTAGRPSVGWYARRVGKTTAVAGRVATKQAKLAAKAAKAAPAVGATKAAATASKATAVAGARTTAKAGLAARAAKIGKTTAKAGLAAKAAKATKSVGKQAAKAGLAAKTVKGVTRRVAA